MTAFKNLQDVLGTKVNLVCTERELPASELNKKARTLMDYRLNDPSFEKAVAHLGRPVRIWVPNCLGTMDLQTARANIVVDKNGIVINVYMG